MTTTTKKKPSAAPAAQTAAARRQMGADRALLDEHDEPTPRATTEPKARFCAFCGKTKAEAKESVLSCVPYIGALPIAPPFDSPYAHLSCVRTHREREIAETWHAAPSPRASRRAGRTAAARIVAPLPTFDGANAPDAEGSPVRHVRIPRVAAIVLGLTTPTAYWGRVTCRIDMAGARGSAHIAAAPVILQMIAEHAASMADGAMQRHPIDGVHAGSVRRALTKASAWIGAALAEPASSTFTF